MPVQLHFPPRPLDSYLSQPFDCLFPTMTVQFNFPQQRHVSKAHTLKSPPHIVRSLLLTDLLLAVPSPFRPCSALFL
jgi:hypothetical protein